MTRSNSLCVLLIFLKILPVISATNLNYSQCAIVANNTFWQAPSDIFFRDQSGKPTGNLSQAWGISYYDCKRLCQSQANSAQYDWRLFTESLGSWLIPWLALTAQLPFESKDNMTNFMALLLAVGSPSHIAFSLFLTILNARSINRVFRQVKEQNEPLNRPLQTKAIKAARTFLIESQQTPIQIYNGPRREFAHLVACPENWAWWNYISGEILKTKRGWTYSLYVQIGWVCVAQLLAIIDFFTSSAFNNSIGIGLAINSLWIWMLPIIIGWVYVGTQNDVGSTKVALISATVPVLGNERGLSGRCIGIRDRTIFHAFDPQRSGSSSGYNRYEEHISEQKEKGSRDLFLDLKIHSSDPEQAQACTDPDSFRMSQELQENPSTSAPHFNISCSGPQSHGSNDIELIALSKKPQVGISTHNEIEKQSQPFIEQSYLALSPCSFLGFSIAGHELEPGAIFNYARIWSHMNAVEHVAEAFMIFTERQKSRQTVDGQPWAPDQDKWDENLKGSPEDFSRYISPLYKDEPDFSIHARGSSELVLNCIIAAFLTVFLQWGSTGAAITIAYNTPVVGLGCQSGAYLIYGLVSTIIWLTLSLSAYLSHRWSLLREIGQVPRHSILGPLAVMIRLAGNLLAAANAGFVVVSSVLQFTNLMDNCWCAACILTVKQQAGWVILFASGSQIAAASKPAWVGGVFMSIVSAALVTICIFMLRGDEIFKRSSR